MAQQSYSPNEELLDEYDVSAFGIDKDSDRFDWFMSKVIDEAVEILVSNLQNPYSEPEPDNCANYARKHALDPDNMRDVKVRDKALSDARVTFWLRDAPRWANDADTRKLIDLHGSEDCHVVIDIRPF